MFWLVRRCVLALNFIDHSTVQIRGNITLARNLSSSRQHYSVEFHVQMHWRDTRRQVLEVNLIWYIHVHWSA